MDPYLAGRADATVTIGCAGQASGDVVARAGDDCARGALLGDGTYDRGSDPHPASEFVTFVGGRLSPGVNRVTICLMVGGNTGRAGST